MVVKRGRSLGRRGKRRLLGVAFTVHAGSTAGFEGWITCRKKKRHAATEGCYDPEPFLTDLLSHGRHAQIEMCRQVSSFCLGTCGVHCAVLTCD